MLIQIFLNFKLFLRANHSLRIYTSHRSFCNRNPCRSNRSPRQGNRYKNPLCYIRPSTNDLKLSMSPTINLTNIKFIRIWMLLNRGNLTNHNCFRQISGLNFLNLTSFQNQIPRNILRTYLRWNIFFQKLQMILHTFQKGIKKTD